MAIDKTGDYASPCNINHRVAAWCGINVANPGNQAVLNHKGSV
jgi:hypothetical protein